MDEQKFAQAMIPFLEKQGIFFADYKEEYYGSRLFKRTIYPMLQNGNHVGYAQFKKIGKAVFLTVQFNCHDLESKVTLFKWSKKIEVIGYVNGTRVVYEKSDEELAGFWEEGLKTGVSIDAQLLPVADLIEIADLAAKMEKIADDPIFESIETVRNEIANLTGLKEVSVGVAPRENNHVSISLFNL